LGRRHPERFTCTRAHTHTNTHTYTHTHTHTHTHTQEVSSLGRPQPERFTRKELARQAALKAQQVWSCVCACVCVCVRVCVYFN
jgi:carbohydrate-binding DOMON domain-containing protein